MKPKSKSVRALQREIVEEPRIAASVTTSLAYLRGKHSILEAHPTAEDFSYALIDTTDRDPKGCAHHFISLRNHLSRVLWRNQIFIGHSILEDLVYQVILLNVADPVWHLFRFLKHQGFQDNGVVLYPIHSFGILGFGFLQVISKVRASVFFREFGMAITPQTNDYNETFHFLQDAFTSFGIKRPRSWKRVSPCRCAICVGNGRVAENDFRNRQWSGRRDYPTFGGLCESGFARMVRFALGS